MTRLQIVGATMLFTPIAVVVLGMTIEMVKNREWFYLAVWATMLVGAVLFAIGAE